jgi:hypothetical protein
VTRVCSAAEQYNEANGVSLCLILRIRFPGTILADLNLEYRRSAQKANFGSHWLSDTL